jgi:signal transduction histidine kinase
MERNHGMVAQVWGACFGTAFLLALSAGFEWHVSRRARIWRMLVTLELASLLAYAANGLAQWLWQSLSLIPAAPGALPTSTSGVINLLIASQILLVYWVVTYVFPYATDDVRLRALEADRLRRAAELAHLRSSLEPHFLLNTLNAIAGLISEDPKEARRLIVALGELLADSLDDRDIETVGEQVEWLRRYASILETRHRERLRVSWEIAELARPVVVPRFLLQPLVENAIVHGALKHPVDGEVHVRAIITQAETGPRLVCEVRDNGPGLGSGMIRAGAKGLALVQSRLDTLAVGASVRLEAVGAGTCAIVELPLPDEWRA